MSVSSDLLDYSLYLLTFVNLPYYLVKLLNFSLFLETLVNMLSVPRDLAELQSVANDRGSR
jgi:hypothetical protein